MARAAKSAVATGLLLVVLLVGCTPLTSGTPSDEPVGPPPPSSNVISLGELATVVAAEDSPPLATFAVGAASTSGADLQSAQDYWVAVGGAPDECADVAAAPFLVRETDGERAETIDDPTGTLATFVEAEDLFGLIQVYGRTFDDDADALAFLQGLRATVDGCTEYQFTGDDGSPTYIASNLVLEESPSPPAGMTILHYREDPASTGALSVTTAFILKRNAVVTVYSELYPSSTMTLADVGAVTEAVTRRLAGF